MDKLDHRHHSVASAHQRRSKVAQRDFPTSLAEEHHAAGGDLLLQIEHGRRRTSDHRR